MPMLDLTIDRRGLMSGAAAGLALAGLPAMAQPRSQPAAITPQERAARVAKLQGLMRRSGLSAVVIEAGSSLRYFTGVQWGRSERPTLAVIPAEGTIGIVTPFFEEPSVRETLALPAEVRTWQEDEDALGIAAGLLRDRKALGGPVGVEETTRYFIVDALSSYVTVQSAAAEVRACRMIKSPAEIALMQAATDITIAAYRAVHGQVVTGMTRQDIAALMTAATTARGGAVEFSLVLLGEASAYPHGSRQRQALAEGMVVLMDCGCAVEGYQSDVSRTFVFGEASRRQRTVWEQVHEGQQIAFRAAKVGASAGSVDDAVRAFYERIGYGPRYRLPGLSHRTGHGIGLDGHEPVNLVHGETTPLAPGMCFSNEPGLYLPGSFGVRLEDCFHMTDAGPQWFSEPPPSIDKPFG